MQSRYLLASPSCNNTLRSFYRLSFKASKVVAESIRPLVRINAIGLLGAGIGAIFGALHMHTEDSLELLLLLQ